MRQKSLNVLEFDKIKTLVEKETMSDLGREKVVEMEPATDIQTVEFQMNETDMLRIIFSDYCIMLITYSYVNPIFKLTHIITPDF